MNKTKNRFKGNVDSICPTCRKGVLVAVADLGGEPMILECTVCKNRFYKNAGGELEELGTKEMIDEIKDYEQKKKKEGNESK